MCKELKDDPRQVLAILNSLGIVNLTAQELKAFLKALKLYRKILQTNFQETKEKINTRILQDHYVENHKLNLHESNILNTIIIHEKQKVFNNCSEIVENNIHSSIRNNKKETILSIKDNPMWNKNHLPSNKLYRIGQESKKSSKFLETVNNVKIIQPTQKLKNMQSSMKTGSFESSTRFQLFTRSKSQVSMSNKKIINDPVALYNQYRDQWNRLLIPGEATHTKLRWAIREKILGSNLNSKV